MIFLTYDFVWFALTFLGVYSLTRSAASAPFAVDRSRRLVSGILWRSREPIDRPDPFGNLVCSGPDGKQNYHWHCNSGVRCNIAILQVHAVSRRAVFGAVFTRKHKSHKILVAFGYPTRHQLFYVRSSCIIWLTCIAVILPLEVSATSEASYSSGQR